jgi:hypothetical protein
MLAKGSRQLSIMAMNPEVYHLFARACPYILIWLMGFLALTIFTLMVRAYRKQENIHRDTMVGGELPGILLVLMHSVCFGYSCFLHDWLSALIFGWWGPGFLVIATLVVAKRQVNWQKIARATSVTCKLNYLLLVGFFSIMAITPRYSLTVCGSCMIRFAWRGCSIMRIAHVASSKMGGFRESVIRFFSLYRLSTPIFHFAGCVRLRQVWSASCGCGAYCV